MTVTTENRPAAGDVVEHSSLRLLAELAPTLVPVMYEVGEKTWPRLRESQHRKFGPVGPMVTVREELPRRFAVLLRRRDLGTLQICWRLEIGGPVELFEWDSSGRIHGDYGVRYPVISIAPVVDESGSPSGYAVNSRQATSLDGTVQSIDARLDSAVFVRSGEPNLVADAIRAVSGHPKVEEFRPGIHPTPLYFQTLQFENKTDYFLRRGVNEYIGPGWSPTTIEQAFEEPTIRAVALGRPGEDSLTPNPEKH